MPEFHVSGPMSMSDIIFPLIIAVIISTITPFPAMACFYAAWGRPVWQHTTFRRLLLVVPTVAFPIALLALHAANSQPTWKDHGEELMYYIARGSAAWVFFPPFVAANYLVARTVHNFEYLEDTVLTPISLVTCILICAFFTLWNIHLGGQFIFPASAGIAYSFGLYLFLKARGVPPLKKQQLFLIAAWLLSGVSTVFVGALRAKQVIAELPDEAPPECFIVTAAAKGHRGLVGSSVDPVSHRITNGQLQTFRAFEHWLRTHAPATHCIARRIYNVVVPPIARSIMFRWQADFVYLTLKPIEWCMRMVWGKIAVESRAATECNRCSASDARTDADSALGLCHCLFFVFRHSPSIATMIACPQKLRREYRRGCASNES